MKGGLVIGFILCSHTLSETNSALAATWFLIARSLDHGASQDIVALFNEEHDFMDGLL